MGSILSSILGSILGFNIRFNIGFNIWFIILVQYWVHHLVQYFGSILGSIFGSILGLILGFKYYVKYYFEGRFPGSRRQWKWHMRGQKFEWNCIKGILISFILNSSVITKNPSFWIYKILYCKERNFLDPYFAFDNCGSWTLWTWGLQLWIHPGS